MKVVSSGLTPIPSPTNEWLAQCNWLLTGAHDAENLRQAIAPMDRYYAEAGWSAEAAELFLALYLEVGELARVCEIFESTPGLSKPNNLAEIRGAASMAYVICLHRRGLDYTAEEIEAALRRFFTKSVLDLLERGQFPTVARWMKLVFWTGEESREAAWRSLRRCYDFLPPSKRP